MFRTLTMVALIIGGLILAFAIARTSIAQAPVVEYKTPQTIQEIIAEVAPMFGQDPKLIGKISFCESGWKSEVTHDGGYGKGVSGYHKTTFEESLKSYEKEYHEKLNYESSYDQLKLMSYDFSRGEKYRRAWTTYRAYANGGTYEFDSKLLKKHFVVHCK